MSSDIAGRLLVAVAALSLAGCEYTILRDFEEEEWQAEWAAIDSLTIAPDLEISGVECIVIPPPVVPRPARPHLPREGDGDMANVVFLITIRNVGTGGFDNPFTLVAEDLHPGPYQTNIILCSRLNQKGEIIAADSSMEVWLQVERRDDSTSCELTLLTNPVLQRELRRKLRYRINSPPIPPVSREFRYDNNDTTVHVPAYRDILKRSQRRQHLP